MQVAGGSQQGGKCGSGALLILPVQFGGFSYKRISVSGYFFSLFRNDAGSVRLRSGYDRPEISAAHRLRHDPDTEVASTFSHERLDSTNRYSLLSRWLIMVGL